MMGRRQCTLALLPVLLFSFTKQLIGLNQEKVVMNYISNFAVILENVLGCIFVIFKICIIQSTCPIEIQK